MLVKDFIKLYNTGDLRIKEMIADKETNNYTVENFKNKALQSISIRPHISFKQKYVLLEQVKENGIDTINGVSTYDTLIGDFLFNIAVLKFYTDLEFSDDNMDELDELKRIGAFDEIMEVFFHDYLTLEKYYKEKVQSILNIENNTQNLLNREIIKVSNRAIETLEKVVSNLDKKTLGSLMNSLMLGVKNLGLDKIISAVSTENKTVPFNVLRK